MYRIDNATAAPTLPAPLAVGSNPNGFFLNTVPGTVVDGDWANAVQEEICGVVTGAGLTLSKTNDAQLLAAIRALTTPTLHPSSNTGTATSLSTSISFTAPSNGILLVDANAGTAGTPNANLSMTGSGVTAVANRQSYVNATGGIAVAEYAYTVAAGATVTITATQTISGGAATIYLAIIGKFFPTT